MGYVNPRNQLGERPEKILLEGQEFEFVTGQRGGESAVYKSENSYARIGSPKKILADLGLHRRMEEAGFPIAKVLVEGEEGGQAYFIESSLGDMHMGMAFASDMEQNAIVSEERFNEFVSVSEQFARAQLTTCSENIDYEDFAKGVLLEQLCSEMPDYADQLRARFEKVKERTSRLPFVVTHGDFNPNNLYPGGVIDLEDSFHGPYGYDLISAISHINYYPDSKEFEQFAKYSFSPEQKRKFFEKMDSVSVEAGLPPLSEFEEDFEFCRALWLVADNPNTPKLREWRYKQMISKFLQL